MRTDREEVTKEEHYDLSNDLEEEDEEEWSHVDNWENEGEEGDDVRDESTAYLEFLNEEVCLAGPYRYHMLILSDP